MVLFQLQLLGELVCLLRVGGFEVLVGLLKLLEGSLQRFVLLLNVTGTIEFVNKLNVVLL